MNKLILRIGSLLFCVSVYLWQSSVHAQPRNLELAKDCVEAPCLLPKKRPSGTRFLLEINGGTTMTDGIGLSLSALIGWGGKLRGIPLRFYLVSEHNFDLSHSDGRTRFNSIRFDDSRFHYDITIGLRVYLPIYGPLRLFGDIMGGFTLGNRQLKRYDSTTSLGDLTHEFLRPIGLLSGGAQFRLMKNLSIGARFKFIYGDDGLNDLDWVIGANNSSIRTSITAGVTWHF